MPGQGTIVATGAIGYPPGLSAVRPGDAARAGRGEGHDHDQHLRPPGHPGRRERRLPRRRSTRSSRAATASTTRSAPASACAAAAPSPRPAPSRGRPGPAPPAAPVASDDALLDGRRRRRCRWSRRTAATATWRRTSTRSVRRLPAIRRSTPEPRRPDARADGPDPGVAAARQGARRELRRRAARSCARPTAARSRTRSSTSPTTSKRLWLRGMIESGRCAQPLAPERRRRPLERLVEVDAFERFLRRTYLGQKTFSIEGVDALVPITDQVIELVGRRGHRRGRAGHGPPRPPGLHHAGRRASARVDPRRVRGPHGVRVGRRGDARDRGRREVPPRRRGHLHHAQRAHGDASSSPPTRATSSRSTPWPRATRARSRPIAAPATPSTTPRPRCRC